MHSTKENCTREDEIIAKALENFPADFTFRLGDDLKHRRLGDLEIILRTVSKLGGIARLSVLAPGLDPAGLLGLAFHLSASGRDPSPCRWLDRFGHATFESLDPDAVYTLGYDPERRIDRAAARRIFETIDSGIAADSAAEAEPLMLPAGAGAAEGPQAPLRIRFDRHASGILSPLGRFSRTAAKLAADGHPPRSQIIHSFTSGVLRGRIIAQGVSPLRLEAIALREASLPLGPAAGIARAAGFVLYEIELAGEAKAGSSIERGVIPLVEEVVDEASGESEVRGEIVLGAAGESAAAGENIVRRFEVFDPDRLRGLPDSERLQFLKDLRGSYTALPAIRAIGRRMLDALIRVLEG